MHKEIALCQSYRATHYADGSDDDIEALEALLEDEAQDLYWVDDHDFGAGTLNIFLYTKEEKAVLEQIIPLAESGRLPKGLRIGTPDEESERYRPLYPPDLKKFDLLGNLVSH